LKRPIFGVAAALLAFSATAAQADEGQTVYMQHCNACHSKIPPKLGDKAAWAPRIKAGMDALFTAAIKGKGKMPPQVGKSGTTPAQVKAAVQYIVDHSK